VKALPDAAITLRELSDAPADRAALAAFYADIYEQEFPDPDERESLANIMDYLQRKSRGWYGLNNYHVLIAESEDGVVGGCLLDYLERPNAGVIEFLFTSAGARGSGLGGRLFEHAEQLLQADAQRAGRAAISWIAAEMNDPYAIPSVPDNLDPFLRARIWDGWGFGALDFPYVQPALSAEGRPVESLLMIAKLFEPEWRKGVAAKRVDLLVAEYLRWAMRIETPSENADYRAMAAWLAPRETVAWDRLKRVIGEDAPRAFGVLEVRDARAPEFEAAIGVYGRAFATPATAVEPASFVRGLKRYGESGYRYHLWGIRDEANRSIAGMASFFSFDGMGFGGYVVLEAGLRGAGCLRPVLARIEQQMRADDCGVRGWLIECENDETSAIFAHCGFRALALDYQQPILPGAVVASTVPLQLMYKPLGRVYASPVLSGEELLAGLAQVLRYVYRVDDPQAHATYRSVAAQVDGRVAFD